MTNGTKNNSSKPAMLRAAMAVSVGAGAIMAFGATPAIAQGAGDDQASGERRLNRVVVEATRREGVTVQDVPVAVTAFDAQLLEETGFKALGDLEQIAPTVQITQTESAASGTSISIRGIGTGSNNPGFEPAVGVLIDGVFRTRTGVALAELPELSSIEVLRGPQGTLFGRNTSAGVVSISTAKPDFDEGGHVAVSYGNFDAFAGEIAASKALNENWAARVDAKYRERDGYVEDVNSDRDFNNIERYFARGQLVYEGDKTDARFIFDYAETDEACCVAVNFIPGPLAPAINAGAATLGLTGISTADPRAGEFAISPNRGFDEQVEEFGVSGQIDHQFDFGKVTSITAYRDWEAIRDQDVDFSGIDRAFREDYTVTDEVFTQELRLQNTIGRLDWLVGGFYMHEELNLTDTIRFGTQADLYTDLVTSGFAGAQFFGSLPFGFNPDGSTFGVPPILGIVRDPAGNPVINPATSTPIPIFVPASPAGGGQQADQFEVTTDAFALFTHNEIALTDAATLTLGARYNREEKDIEENLNAITPGCDFLAANPAALQGLAQAGATALAGLVCNPAVNTEGNGQFEGDRTDEEITGTAKLAYKFTPDIMGYASYSRGFKSGGYNLDRAAFDSRLFGGDGPQVEDQEFDAETVDAFEAGWKSSWMNGQVTLNGAAFYQDIQGFQENIFTGINFRTINTDVESYGLELDAAATPIDGLLFQGGFAWTIAERKGDIALPDGTGGFDVFAEGGQQLSNVPEYVVTGAATYTWPVSDLFDVAFHANVRWNDEAFLPAAPEFREAVKNDSYALFGGRISLIEKQGRYEISLFGENLFEEDDFNLSSFGVPEQTGTIAVYPAQPRFYGAEFRVNW